MFRVYLTLFILLFLGFRIPGVSQDTLFLKKHNLESSVKNVFTIDDQVYAKTSSHLYVLKEDYWEKVNLEFKKPFAFYEDGNFIEYDFLPNKHYFYAERMSHLIPQRGLFNPTKAQKKDRLFVAVSGSLFEYQINPYFKNIFPNVSFRDIYIDQELKVFETYSGIFVNDTIKLEQPGYASGAISKTSKGFYISSDQLFKFIPPDSTILIPSGQNQLAGYARKIVEWNGNLYSQNTRSVNLFSEETNLSPIHEGFEYLDLEAIPNGLVFSTKEGKVFFFDGDTITELTDIMSPVNEIYIDNQNIYLGTDLGVYTLNSENLNELQKISSVPFVAQLIHDSFGNLWISTNDGLFVMPEDYFQEIPFIQKVEFNREALAYFQDTLYAGSIEGLFLIDAISVQKNFLPGYISVNRPPLLRSIPWWVYTIGILFLSLIIASIYLWKQKKKQEEYEEAEKSKGPEFNLELVKEAIITHKLVSVEALAEHFETNTVQLNRIFKAYDTTPGKFLKNVKLDHAKEMIKNNSDWEEISKITGYSVYFLKKQLSE